jgi:hypothetical protein
MSNNNIKIVNLLTPQLMAYDFESNRPSPITIQNGESPNVNNKSTVSSGRTVKKRKTSLRKVCSTFFGDKGPPISNNNKKSVTKGD